MATTTSTTVQTDTTMSEAPPPAPLSSTTTLQNADHPPSSITVSKPTPYSFDLGHLLITDPNPLPPTTQLLSTSPGPSNSTPNPDDILKSTARDGAQTLLNNLLTNRPITSSTNPDSSGLSLSLPPAETRLPRWKPLPKPKQPTKWEAFAKKKGIGRFAGGAGKSGGAQLQERRKNLVFDEEAGEWRRKWGYKGKNKEGEGGEWLVEVDDKRRKKNQKEGPGGKGEGEREEEQEGRNVRMEGKKERMERARRQLRKERSNVKRAGNKAKA